MKKLTTIFITIFITVITAISLPFPTQAQIERPCKQESGATICEAERDNQGAIVGRNGILTRIAQTFVYVAGIIAVIMMVIGGFRYITSGGDPGQTKSAKNTIIYALVGLVIAAFAQALVTFVLNRL